MLGSNHCFLHNDYIREHTLFITQPGRPRPIIVQLTRQRLKADIQRNVKSLKELPRWKTVNISDDLSPGVQAKSRDLRAIHALAKSKGISAGLSGEAIVIEGKRYTHRDIDRELHELEGGKTVSVAAGIAFQGHHSYLSNLYACQFTYDNIVYNSAEQCYPHQAAKCKNNGSVAAKVLACNDPYQTKSYGKQMKESQEWTNSKFEVLERITTKKFRQNPALKERRLATGDLTLFEATTNRLFGCRLTLNQRTAIDEKCPGQNRFGKLLQSV